MPRVLRSLSTCFVPVLALVAIGCSDTGVGDPCIPEQIPAGGFDSDVNYIESQSVSCRTRVCLVYGLEGDPTLSQEECISGGPDGGALACSSYPTQAEIDERVFCSCRCAAPAGSGAPTCDCPGGYTCQEVLTIGSDGERGSYCVPKEVADPAP